MVIRFHFDAERLKKLQEYVDDERAAMIGLTPFVDVGTGITVTEDMIDNGFKLIAPDTLFEDDSLPVDLVGLMDYNAVYTKFGCADREIIVPRDNSKCPKIIKHNS